MKARVILVGTVGACGIAEHSALLSEAVEAVDPDITVTIAPELLDPYAGLPFTPDVLHLNYHAALHSRWTPDRITVLRQLTTVLVTYHDTGVPNSDQCKAICEAADYFVVHEPCTDLPPHGEYLRQGVPAAEDPAKFEALKWKARREGIWEPGQPIVGTVGFPFPWKNYDLLCDAAHEAGWGVLLLAPSATPEQISGWQQRNPHCWVISDFTPRREVVSFLSGCDATAFLYNCANTGTSGAIRQGIAARKPVLAFSDRICRQFRDLADEPAITWLYHGSPADIAKALSAVQPSYAIHELAYRDSWYRKGQAYARIYRTLQDARPR